MMPTTSDVLKHINCVHVFIHVLLSVLNKYEVSATEPEPSFGQPEVNVTVIEGDMAVLPCSIRYLGENQVAWTDAEGFVLTHKDRRIIDDPRLSVERPFTKDWNLHIRDVKYTDTGKYICQINTKPAKKKTIALYVQVPPSILDNLSSSDQTVQEGQTVILTCNATGIPAPEITWFRITTHSNRGRERIGSTGEVLKIYNVSRDCGGLYVCDADNGIEDKASRKIKVNVEFAPEVAVKNSKMGHFPGRETFLQCEVVANPHGMMYWSKDGKEIVGDNKHIVEMFNSDYDEKKVLSLRIRSIATEDFGRYTCIAMNKIGQDRASMLLYDYSRRLTTKPIYIRPVEPIFPETTPNTRYSPPDKNRNKPKNPFVTDSDRGKNGDSDRGKNGGENFGAVKGNSASSSFKQSNIFLIILSLIYSLPVLNSFNNKCV